VAAELRSTCLTPWKLLILLSACFIASISKTNNEETKDFRIETKDEPVVSSDGVKAKVNDKQVVNSEGGKPKFKATKPKKKYIHLDNEKVFGDDNFIKLDDLAEGKETGHKEAEVKDTKPSKNYVHIDKKEDVVGTDYFPSPFPRVNNAANRAAARAQNAKWNDNSGGGNGVGGYNYPSSGSGYYNYNQDEPKNIGTKSWAENHKNLNQFKPFQANAAGQKREDCPGGCTVIYQKEPAYNTFDKVYTKPPFSPWAGK